MREVPETLWLVVSKKTGKQVGSATYGQYRFYDTEKGALAAMRQMVGYGSEDFKYEVRPFSLVAQ